MSRLFKKSTALVLSVIICLAAFSGLQVSAANNHAEGASEVLDFTGVAGTTQKLDANTVMGSTENLTQGNSNIKITYCTRNVNDSTNSTAYEGVSAKNYSDTPDLFDGECGGNTEIASNYTGGFGTVSASSNGRSIMAKYNSTDNTYVANTEKKYSIDFVLDLGEEASVKGFLLSSVYRCAVGDYDLYLSDATQSDPFKTTPVASYTVDLEYWQSSSRTNNERATQGITTWKTKDTNGIKARYIGVRIWVTNTHAPVKAGSSGEYFFDRIRMNELAVYGTYDRPYYNYTVTSNINNINISDKTWENATITAKAPLSEGAYIFKNWIVDGVEQDGTTKSTYNEISTTLTKDNLKIEAIYEIASTTLDLKPDSAFLINKDINIFYVPNGTLVSEVYSSLSNYRSSLLIKDDFDTALETETVKTGMKVMVNVEGGEKMDLVVMGDSDVDGKLTVTDIVATLNYAVGLGELSDGGKQAADANNDSRVTVSDVIIAKNDLGNTYKAISLKMNQISYITTGRTVVQNKGTANEVVGIGATAQGVVFKIDGRGELKLKLNTNKPNSYATVVVDGVEKDIQIADGTAREYTVAENMASGVHEVEVYSQVESHYVGLSGVSFIGQECEEVSKAKDLLIEYVGDSLTAAYGNLIPRGTANWETMRSQNTYWGYAPISARLLDAEWSVIASSGSVLISGVNNTNVMVNRYETATNTPLRNGKKADITVIALGGNDCKVLNQISGTDTDRKNYFKDQAKAFAKKVIEKNGADAKVVFYQSGGKSYAEFVDAGESANTVEMYELIRLAYIEAAEELQEEGIKAYAAPNINMSVAGLHAHPMIDEENGHKDVGEAIANFLRDYVIND